jgi:hypothetical protein
LASRRESLGSPTKYIKENREQESAFEERVLKDILNKKGIIFCQNFWGRGEQGDHIDVWDGLNMACGQRNYYGRSKQVWFWEIKV